jgi:glycosyltransferase involved in cell wall biosynthesis
MAPSAVTPQASTRRLDLLSVCAPVYNEEELVEEFYARASAALEDVARGFDYELIIVNDGSKDRTGEILDRLAEGDPRLRVVHLARNFGHQPALTAGLEHARGDAVVMLDADLQDPPELIGKMVERWREGSDVVYMVREAREGESYFKLATARWFYRLFRALANVELTANSGDFRLLDRRALDALLSMGERSRFLRGMTASRSRRSPTTATRATPARRSTRSARCCASPSTRSRPSRTSRSSSRCTLAS